MDLRKWLLSSMILIKLRTIQNLKQKFCFRNVNLRKFDFMFYSYMLMLMIQVPVPKQIAGYQQIILPFNPEVWQCFGMYP